MHCDSGAQGTAWWELRRAGGSWKVVGAQQDLTCPSRNDIHIAKHVTGLQAGSAYDIAWLSTRRRMTARRSARR